MVKIIQKPGLRNYDRTNKKFFLRDPVVSLIIVAPILPAMKNFVEVSILVHHSCNSSSNFLNFRISDEGSNFLLSL